MARLHMLNSVRDTINTSFIIQQDGLLFVIDGGFPCEAKQLHDYILKLGGVVNGWFLTHIHDDHVGAFATIVSDYTDITVEKVYCNFPSDDFLSKKEPRQSIMPSVELAAWVREAIAIESISQVTMKVGDVYDFGGITFRVLQTPDEATDRGINDSSCVFRVEVNGKSLLFLGDLGVCAGARLLENADHSLLRADYVQMAHHGQEGVDRSVYEVIRPKFCLWCTPSWLWDNINRNIGRYDSGVFKTIIVRGWMSELGCVERHYVMKDGTHIIKL